MGASLSTADLRRAEAPDFLKRSRTPVLRRPRRRPTLRVAALVGPISGHGSRPVSSFHERGTGCEGATGVRVRAHCNPARSLSMGAPRIVQSKRGPIDARRTLTPRDYLERPQLFGEAHDARFTCPADGDRVSLEVSRMLHVCVCAWRRAPHRRSGAALGREFGFSRQTWSDVTRGNRWPGHTVLIALISSLNHKASNV